MMTILARRPFVIGFVATILLGGIVVSAALLLAGGDDDGGGGAASPGPAAVLAAPEFRLPVSMSRLDQAQEALYSTGGSDLYYVGPAGRFAVHPIPLQEADQSALPLGEATGIRAVAKPPSGRAQGRFPDGLLLADSSGTVYLVWEQQRRPVEVLWVAPADLEPVPESQQPAFLVPAAN